MATNIHSSALNVAGSTVTQTTQDFTNEYGAGAEVYLNVSNAGTGSITLTIQGKDPTSGVYYTVLSGAAVTTNSFNKYQVFPGAATTANVSVNDLMPFKWRVVVTSNNSNPMTYSVGVTVFG